MKTCKTLTLPIAALASLGALSATPAAADVDPAVITVDASTPIEQVEIGTAIRVIAGAPIVVIDDPLTSAPTTTTVTTTTLPETGGPQGFLAWVGLGVLAAGAFLVGVSRRGRS